MAGPFGAAHVGTLFDVVIDGWGYRFADSVSSHPFGTHRASYGYTPRFLPRTNIQGDYGDNFQDFWVTLTQRDWSLGQGQRNFKSSEDESSRMFWQGRAVKMDKPGEVVLDQQLVSATAAANLSNIIHAPAANSLGMESFFFTTTDGNLRSIDYNGTLGNLGAHGAGSTNRYSIASDSHDVYISGTTKIRKYNVGAATFSDFNTDGVSSGLSLAYLNNSLYGFENTCVLYVFDTAGVRTAIHSFKDADGGTFSNAGGFQQIHPFGGDLLVFMPGVLLKGHGPQVWVYDGTGVSLLFTLPTNFVGANICVSYGVIFVAGAFCTPSSTAGSYLTKGAVWYYVNGQLGILFKEDFPGETSSTTDPANVGNSFYFVLPFDDGILFACESHLMGYSVTTGALREVSDVGMRIGAHGAAGICIGDNSTGLRIYPDGTNLATSGYVISSLMDGDNSLTKHFHSIRIDGEKNAGTFDLAYKIDSLSGAYTSLQTNATPGTEYELPNDSTSQGRSISVKVTLNRASATAGPTLRRVQCRAAFILDNWNRREYLIELTGRDGEGMMKLRNGQQHDLDGLAQAQNLVAAAESSLPITIIDRFGTFTGIIDNDGFEMVEIRPDQFIARVPVRET